MNSRCTFILLSALSLLSPPAKTEERIVESRIVSASLFKNGLAVITREVALAGPGIHVLEQVPAAVHSTLWLEGPEDLTARSTLREIVVADGLPNFSNLQQQLAGREVTLHLKGEPERMMKGKVTGLRWKGSC